MLISTNKESLTRKETNQSNTITCKNDNLDNIFEYETNINGVIDEFEQGGTNDCWLLSELNSLSQKSWGKKVIKNAIQPDGKGGAIITLKGAEGNQKSFHVTKKEIIEVRKKQSMGDFQYSFGDDDVLAVELATEKYFNTQGEHSLDGFKIKKCSLADIVNLFTGSSKRVMFKALDEDSYVVRDYTQFLESMEKNPNKYIATVGFKKGNKAGCKNNHAYEIYSIKKAKCGHKIVTIVDPHDNTKKFDIDYYTFLNSLDHLKFNVQPGESLGNIDQLNYDALERKISTYKYNEEHKSCKTKLEKEKFYSEFSEIIKMQDKDTRKYKLNNYLLSNRRYANVFNNYLKENCHKIIAEIDNAEWGWGHGKDKKDLIMPLIQYIEEQAIDKKISVNEIQEFKDKCLNELDAIFYTNENRIIDACQNILQRICELE